MIERSKHCRPGCVHRYQPANRRDSCMHAVLITFHSAAQLDDLREPFAQYAEALHNGAVAGLISKTWLADGATVGGFHIFRDRAAADGYLGGMFAEAIGANAAFSDIRIEHFDVIEELSAATNGIPVAVASR